MKKVLIITYYWVPSGGAGVQRWLKFVKYLRNFGWEPIVYTPENPELPATDPSLEKDVPEDLSVLKTRIWEPYTAYKQFVGRKKDDRIKSGFLSEKKNPGVAEKISVWIRGNLFIPDARKYWIKPSVNYLSEWLSVNHIDAVVSTGPPHSMHLIARELHRNFGIPWLADFRDPWTSIDFYHNLMLTRFSDRRHHRLEKSVLTEADRVIVVSEGMKSDFRAIVNRDYEVITNGFDETERDSAGHELDKKFTLSHIGSMVPARNPVNLWRALRQIADENPVFADDLEIRLIGQTDFSIKESIRQNRLEKYTNYIPYLPHSEVAKIQASSQVLLLVINQTANAGMVTTGKIFEYIASGRPVFCVGPVTGDAARIISDTNTGFTIDQMDITGIKITIGDFYRQFKEGTLKTHGHGVEKYSRHHLTGKMAEALDAMTGQS